MLCGGHSEARAIDAEERDMFVGLKEAVEAMGGQTYSEFEPVSCTSQVVAGTIFWVKARTNQDFVHFKVFRPLPHTGNPAEVQVVHTGQTEDAAFNING